MFKIKPASHGGLNIVSGQQTVAYYSGRTDSWFICDHFRPLWELLLWAEDVDLPSKETFFEELLKRA